MLKTKLKKVFTRDFILFALITLTLWLVLFYALGFSVTDHVLYDQHTLQALAWQKGHVNIASVWFLEIAEYQDKRYNSFPPTPTFIELPLTYIFGRLTPNSFVLLLSTWVSMLLSFFIFLKLTKKRFLSYFLALAFFWGSNILYLSLFGAVWNQGQLYGLFFTILAFFILFHSHKKWPLIIGAFCLGLAVGCRPFYLFMAPLFLYYSYQKFPHWKTFIYTIVGLGPPGIFYAVYNWVRFGDILEFGHVYLPHSQDLGGKIFSCDYLARNLHHVFLQIPVWNFDLNRVDFDDRGIAIWISSPIILLGLVFFFQKKISVPEKIISGLCLIAIWVPLLLHESNGWLQFGYRYSIDLIPLLLILVGRTLRRNYLWLFPLALYSVLINIYGAVWFYKFSEFFIWVQ